MYTSSTHEFKENVPVVYAFLKTCKSLKSFFFLLYILTSKIEENNANRIK